MSVTCPKCRTVISTTDTNFKLQEQLAKYKQRAEAAEAKLRELEMQEPIGEVIAADTPSINWMISWKPGKRPKTGDKLYAKPFQAPKQEGK